MPSSAFRRFTAALTAFAITVALVVAAPFVAAPASAATVDIDGAVFRWGVNVESNAAAFAPGTINHFSAGIAEMTSPSDRVTVANWKQSEGNVSIEKRQSGGGFAAATFAGLRTTPDGTTITTGNGRSSEHEVVISDGVGTVDVAAGTASIQWTGTFTFVYYSGMTRFWVQDPRLDVAADGTGTVTATLGGWGTSMEDPEAFSVLTPVDDIVIADLTGVNVTADGIVVTPDYRGVSVSTPEEAVAQVNNAHFGSFPQSFVDFQLLTGQHAYWFSSGGAADVRKPTTPITITYDAAAPAVDAPVITAQPAPTAVEAGLEAVFTVAATSSEAVTVQWQRSANGTDWSDIEGATAAELRFVAVEADDEASFRAIVTNSGGSATSDAAVLTVTPGTIDPVVVSDAQLQWAYSGYAQAGVFGAWRQWTSGTGVSLTTLDGKSVTGLDADAGRDFTAVRYDGGTGVIDAETGAGTITWPDAGSWMLNAYPAMYGAPDETLSSPILTINEDGTGSLSFAAFLPAHNDIMYGTGIQPAVGPDRKVLATFSSVSIVDGVITVVPDFAGREYTPAEGTSPWTACTTEGGIGGSWPSEWIDFLPTSVRAHYYTTSCSGLNLTKPPFAFSVSTTAVAPVITEQPSATQTTLAASSKLGLSVVATGNPISYQWQRSLDGTTWTDIAGETDAAYQAEARADDNGASFRVVVGSGAGAVNSDVVGPYTITTAPIVVTRQPGDFETGVGGTLSFVAYASGAPRPTALWERSFDGGTTWVSVNEGDFIDRSTPGTQISDSTVLIPVAEESDHAQYRVTWSNGLETVVSTVVAGTVLNQVPTVRTQPVNAATISGVNGRFVANFDGLPAPTYQWQYSIDNGTSWADWTATTATSATLTVPTSGTALDGALFRLSATAPAGTAVTEAAKLTVLPRTGQRAVTPVILDGELGVSTARIAVLGEGFEALAGASGTPLRVGFVAKSVWEDGSFTTTSNQIASASVSASSLTTNSGGFSAAALSIAADRIQSGVEYGVVVYATASRDYDTWIPLIGAAEPIEIDNAQLQWTYSGYAQAGVFGPWRQWTNGTGVSVVTVDGQVGSGQAADAGKTFTGARFDGGTGELDPETGAGTISWPNTGAWVINAYPANIGAPDETLSAPILTINADGRGTLSFDATLPAHADYMSGGGWVEQVGPERTVVATFSSVTIAEDGTITVVPEYQGREYVPAEGLSPWASCDGVGGSWPKEWIDFVAASVRAHYYTTSCAGLNLTKGPHPFTVTTASIPLEITKQQDDVTVNASRPLTLSVGANGNPMPLVTWQQRVDGEWVTAEGLTGLTVETTAATTHAGTWRPVFTVGSTVTYGDEFDITVNTAAPSFVQNPFLNYAEYGVGERVTIISGVTGYPMPTASWERSNDGGETWVPVTEGVEFIANGEAANANLIFTASAADAGARFRVTLTNGVGEPLVGEVGPIVIRNEPIVITTQPRNYLVPQSPLSGGAAQQLTVAATGFPIRSNSYQWQVLDETSGQWTNVGTANANYTAQFTRGSASYRVIVGSGEGAVTSDVARVVVVPGQAGRVISVASQTVNAGDTVTFAPTLNPAGNPAPAAQWQRSTDAGTTWTNIPGATSTTLSFVATQADHNARYRIVLDNGVPGGITAGVTEVSQLPNGTAVSSAPATLTVQFDKVPVITTQPQNTVSFVGQSASFTAAFDTYPAATYRWSTSIDDGATWQEVAGAAGETTTLTIASPTAGQDGLLARITATNPVGSTTSNTAALTVLTPAGARDIQIVPDAPIVTTQATTITVLGTGYTWDSSVPARERILRVNIADATFWQPGQEVPTGNVGWLASTTVSAANLSTGTFRVTMTIPAGLLTADGSYGIATTSNVPTARNYDGWKALTLAVAPTASVDATETSVLAGSDVELTATATGTPAPTLQWQRALTGGEFADIVGETDETLSLADLTQTAQYRVVATNTAGTVASEPVTLTVLGAPTVTVSKVSGLDADGEIVTVVGTDFLPAHATGDVDGVTVAFARIGTDWRPSQSGTARTVIESVDVVPDANGRFETQLTVRTGAVTAAGEYAVITFADGDATALFETATPVALVEAGPVITQQPVSVIAPIQPATGPAVAPFTVAATGEPTPSIQWERLVGTDWVAIDGAVAPSLSLAYTATDAGAQVRAVVTSPLGSATSDVATLTLGDRPTVQPLAESVSVVQGDDLVLEAVVTGTAATLQWQVREAGSEAWVDIDGAGAVALTVPAAQVRHGQQYRLEVDSPIPGTPAGAPAVVVSLPAQVNLLAPQHEATDVPDEELTGDATIEVTSFDGTTAVVQVGTEYTGRHVGAWLHSDPISLGWVLVAGGGSATVTIPAGTPAGDHRIVIVDETGALIGWAAITVGSAPGQPTPLASTGAELPMPIIGGALLLLLLGAGLVVTRRVRRS